MQLLFKQKIKTLLKKVGKYGCMGVFDVITLTVTQISKKKNTYTSRYVHYMVVLLLLILILLSKTICRLSFSVFSVLITWQLKYGRDFKTWKDSSIEQMSANGLAVGALAFKIP